MSGFYLTIYSLSGENAEPYVDETTRGRLRYPHGGKTWGLIWWQLDKEVQTSQQMEEPGGRGGEDVPASVSTASILIYPPSYPLNSIASQKIPWFTSQL